MVDRPGISRALATLGGAVVLAASGVLLAGCGSSSGGASSTVDTVATLALDTTTPLPEAGLYTLGGTWRCLSTQTTVRRAPSSIISSKAGGLLVTRPEALLYVAFNVNEADAKLQASRLKHIAGLLDGVGTVAIRKNVVFWTNGDKLTPDDLNLIDSCLQ